MENNNSPEKGNEVKTYSGPWGTLNIPWETEIYGVHAKLVAAVQNLFAIQITIPYYRDDNGEWYYHDTDNEYHWTEKEDAMEEINGKWNLIGWLDEDEKEQTTGKEAGNEQGTQKNH